MTAELGNNTSYTWRGIHKARSVLARGLRRRIDDGTTTSVWRDAWMVGTQAGRVLSPCVQGHEDMKLEELIRPNGEGWDCEKLEHFFLPFECERIAGIQLVEIGQEMSGFGAMRGIAFKPLSRLIGIWRERTLKEGRGASDWEREKWLWNRLWKIPVWPRVKLFFWELCGEALATKANIVTRVEELYIDLSDQMFYHRLRTMLYSLI
ncbi:uncharacterized protein LOC141640725 [Silene latifolia]|uniref:uncharacterized protein LOC141640725 n=1 Tax=Silene latifolia TaxID=37657 RepID=UPI003D775042